jgi:adenylate cyclase
MTDRTPHRSGAADSRTARRGRRRARPLVRRLAASLLKVRRLHVPLAVNLFTIMAAITVAVVLALSLFTMWQGRAVAESTARALSRELTAKVAHRVETLFSPAAALTALSSSLPDIARPPDLLVHPMGWFLMRALESYPKLYSGYIGLEDGRFYQIIAVPDRPETAEEEARRANAVRLTHGAPPGTRFIHRVILPRPDGGRIQAWTFLDRDRVLLGSRVDAGVNYDPTVRPWYTLARDHNETVMTDIYAFHSLGLPGVTLARRFDGDVAGVFGIDLTLASISDFIAAQSLSPNGRLLVGTADGQVIVYRGRDGLRTGAEYVRGRPLALADLRDPAILRALYAPDAQTDVQVVPHTQGGEPILVRRLHVSMPVARDVVVAMAAPLSDFTGPVDDLVADSLVFAFAVALFGIPATWLVARRMSRALALLAEDAERIRTLDLDRDVQVRTVVREIHDLARAQRTMKESLRTFGLYVPRDVVRTIMASGGSAAPGGRRRELSLMFTDIRGFTTLAEQTPAEELMVRTSQYFEEITAAVNAHQGVVDKFIGDAVMAIWNAPNPVDDHVAKACLAVLEAHWRLAAFNADLEARGLPPFPTRFGLHVGEAVVGNVGSSVRMDYSAIGAAVNMASRIEGVNKAYGTAILVSEDVARRVSRRFVMREVDHVQPKGAIQSLGIFELLGQHPDSEDPPGPLVASRDTVAFVARWAAAQDRLRRAHDIAGAADAFAALARERPDDSLAANFRDLTATLGADPEAAARWSGVRRLERK